MKQMCSTVSLGSLNSASLLVLDLSGLKVKMKPNGLLIYPYKNKFVFALAYSFSKL